jgi:hypothetical protein
MGTTIQCCLDFSHELDPDRQDNEAAKLDCVQTIAATRLVVDEFLQGPLRRHFAEAYEQSPVIEDGFKSRADGALLSVNIFVPFNRNMAEVAGAMVEVLCLRLGWALPIYKEKVLVTIGPARAPA